MLLLMNGFTPHFFLMCAANAFDLQLLVTGMMNIKKLDCIYFCGLFLTFYPTGSNCKTMLCSSDVSSFVTFCLFVCLFVCLETVLLLICCWVILVLLTSATYIFVML